MYRWPELPANLNLTDHCVDHIGLTGMAETFGVVLEFFHLYQPTQNLKKWKERIIETDIVMA